MTAKLQPYSDFGNMLNRCYHCRAMTFDCKLLELRVPNGATPPNKPTPCTTITVWLCADCRKHMPR